MVEFRLSENMRLFRIYITVEHIEKKEKSRRNPNPFLNEIKHEQQHIVLSPALNSVIELK